MNEKQIEALKMILEYLRADEEKHYQESNCPDDHIFMRVTTLDEYLRDMDNAQ